MKRLGKLTAMMLSLAVIMVFGMTSVFAAADEGEFDWDNNLVIATGTGAGKATAPNPGIKRAQAKVAARVVAQRNLAETINGVAIESLTAVTDSVLDTDAIKASVSGMVKGARELKVEYDEYNNCIVTMGVPIFGVTSAASAVMPKLPQAAQKESFPAPVPDVVPAPPVTIPGAPTYAENTPQGVAAGNFTGVIIDCRGLGLRPGMGAVIYNDMGQPIYGYKNLDIDQVIANGMIGYAYDIANVSRTGANPLVIKAVSVKNQFSAVVSSADANRILLENERTHFLDKTSVVFVRDRY